MEIVLTDLENAAEALSKEADAYFVKPIKMQRLHKAIKDKLS